MRFSPGDNADGSTVEDRRGMGGKIGMAGGGLGIVGVLLVVLVRALGGDVSTDPGPAPQADPRAPGNAGVSQTKTTSATLSGSCEGVTSATDQGKFVTCVETNVQKFWRDEFAKSSKVYEVSKLVLFSDQTRSACGAASASSGPFYCPLDQKVYLDTSFFRQLTTRLGATGGDFAEAYVVAHEYGHHVQGLMGTEKRVRNAMDRDPRGRSALSVALELQADCYAGVWGHSAYGAGKVSKDEIAQALDAAAAVGDDRIQKETRGRVNPETFTHGSAADRQRWFNTGMSSGDPAACDTFAGR